MDSNSSDRQPSAPGGRLLDTVDGPADLSRLGLPELRTLAQEIRRFLVTEVSRTGGHLGPNLGVVELTIALHRVFDSPRDVLLWDTGHQAYVHKLLTGRKDFSRLRAKGGLSGYPSRSESEHDVIENSHASTALSYADGLATANRLRGFHDRCVVAVVGDGALTGGMAWEALNNIAAAKDRPLVIVVNDNERSYAPTVGGLADHLATLRTSAGYEAFLQRGKEILTGVPFAGRTLYDALHGAKKGLKDFLTPQGLFEDLGLKYVGPVDGHDLVALETALRRAKGFPGPVVVHCLTRKGKGYRPAEEHQADRLHAIGPRRAAPRATGPSWTSVFSDEIVRIGAERPDVVAITAAMREPVGLEAFAAAFPERTFDVGIAEQHAVTCAAGLAAGGMHPVVALYATFLNRAFDQVLMDVALHKAGVTFVLDRAGVTGNDGPSHHGMWDMSILQVVPGLRLAAPRDGARLRARLAEAVAVSDAPTVVRYPKGAVPDEVPAVGHVDGVDILAGSAEASADVLIVSVGAMAATAVRVGEALAGAGVSVTVVDPEWVQPVAPALTTLAGRHGLVAVLEDNVVVGGVGSVLSHTLREAHVSTPVLQFGLPRCFLPHADRSELLEEAGLTPDQISRSLLDSVTRCGLLDDRRAS